MDLRYTARYMLCISAPLCAFVRASVHFAEIKTS